MLEHHFRPTYQKFLIEPLLRSGLIKHSPHFITLLACCTGVLIIPALYFHLPIIATILLLLSGYLDSLDGSVARSQNLNDPKGAVYDIVSDRIVEAAIVLGLFLYEPFTRALLSLTMLGSILVCVTSFLVVGIFTENNSHKGFHYSPGLIERPEAFIFFIAMIWLPNYFNYLAALFSGLVLLTSYLRVREFTAVKPI